MNLYQKLVEIRKHVDYLKKEANGPQYQYVSSSQVLASVRAKMNELGVLLVSRVTGHQVTPTAVQNKDKYDNIKITTTYFTELDMEMTWINAENPEETLVIPWYGQGVDIAGEKGVGKAMTYAEKYFMLKQFNIPTDKDDPDAFQAKHGNDDINTSMTQEQFETTPPIPYEPAKANHSDDTKPVCSSCGKQITIAVQAYSTKNFGKALCQPCQKKTNVAM